MSDYKGTYTDNLNLSKDDVDDSYDVGRVNSNSDKIDKWAGEVNTRLNKNTQEIENIKSTYATNADLATTNNAVAVQTARIDSFVSLPEGTGVDQAEITDARIGADGVTYENVGSAIRTQIGNILEEVDTNIIYKCFDGDISNPTNIADDRWWLNDYQYPAGHVDKIEFKANATGTCKVMILDSVYNKILKIEEVEVSQTGVNTFTIDMDIPRPFIVGIRGSVGYVSRTYSSINHKFMVSSTDVTEGSTFTPTWSPSSDDETTYVMALQVKYDGLKDASLKAYVNSTYAPKVLKASLDFDDLSYINQSNTWISVDESSSNTLVNAPNGDTWGYYALTNEVFYESYKDKYIKQIAYTRRSESCTDDIPRTFIRYLIYDKITKALNKNNAGIYVWKDTNELSIPNNYITSDMLSDTEIIHAPFDFSVYSSNSANESYYINNFIYPKGYVKSFELKISGDEDKAYEIVIIKSYDNIIIDRFSGTGHGIVSVAVNKYIGTDYYIAVKAPSCAFISGTYKSIGYNFIANNTIANGIIGSTVNLTWEDRAETDTVYVLAVRVKYKSLQELVNNSDNAHLITHNRMFVAGDSITAGHPYESTTGIHWWETVGRTLGYEVTVGAKSGSGMSYWKGTNACKIATQTDFTQYDVAIFAFGTNDYGNDIEIGSLDDTYTYSEDSSQTLYASVKYVINTVMTSNPSIILLFALPINRCDKGTIESKYAYGTANSTGHTLSDYCDAIIEICDYYGIQYIDRRNSAFNSYSIPTLLGDNLHPTISGYKILGQEMSARVGALIVPYNEYNE